MNSENELIAPMLNSGWSKFNKYYELSDDTHAYVTAVVLNPRRNWKWLEKKWSETQLEWVKIAKKKVRKVWETEYKPATTAPPPSQTTNAFLTDLLDSDDEEFALRDEYELYCAQHQRCAKVVVGTNTTKSLPKPQQNGYRLPLYTCYVI